MTFRNRWFRIQTLSILALLSLIAVAWTTHLLMAQTANTAAVALDPSFDQYVKPFLDKKCGQCHNADNVTAGVRVDNLDTSLNDKHIRVWEGIKHRVENGTMPPKGLPQPTAEERQKVVEWINQALEVARLRPAPKNGAVRRLTVSQYRNTIRELLKLDDDVAQILPPDAISVDGFVNNKETLQLSPLQIEAYLEIADDALGRSIVDPKSKPKIQNFRLDLGANINKNPLPEKLVLGANSMLLNNEDFTVTQLTPAKPFAYDPFFMRTKYRFIEGYAGNDTVRGWREYDSIYHSVFACMRGTPGYPKGMPYDTVPEGLLLRPAIPNEELFDEDGSYGHRANFKISLRELPDNGRFRVVVMAAKYNDGLVLDPGVAPQADAPTAIVARNLASAQSVDIPKAGVYQVDVHANPRKAPSTVSDASKLSDSLAGYWSFNEELASGKLEGKARIVTSPFGKAVSLENNPDAVIIPHNDAFNVATGDFSISTWVRPGEPRGGGALVNIGGFEYAPGWTLAVGPRGVLRLETTGPNAKPNGTITSIPGVLRPNVWQHIAVVARRNDQDSYIYVNGYQVGKGKIGNLNLNNPDVSLQIGRIKNVAIFHGELDEVRLYRRALEDTEIQALIEPGRQFAKAPPEKPQDLTLNLGDREFTGTLKQPAFVVVRLPAGPLKVDAKLTGVDGLSHIAFTPISETTDTARRFLAFEKRSPRVGVHVGLRRDCGSTFAPVGVPQTVKSTNLTRFVFEGAIANFPSPNVEKDNVNYLAGIREIAVRSEYTDGRDMPRMLIRSVEFEGPFYESWPPPSHKSIFIESQNKANLPVYARQVIRNFATRAYRRPITASEEASLVSVYNKSFAAGGNFQSSIKDALQVVLTSPQFLFIVEKSATPKPEPLDSYELSSKLSYFLWNSPPDRTTLSLAAAGTLRKQLDAEVDRLIVDPRFERFTQEFASQWLALDKFNVLEPDRKRFPNLTRDNRANLRQEPVQYVQHLIRQNLPVSNLVKSDFLVANEVTATYYDLGDKVESGFNFVAIPHGRRELGGVLTQASILAGLSDGRESNPVKRGAWLARRIVAEPPSDPPPNVPALQEDTKGLTLRQRIEQHRSSPGCVQCHLKIDPWGVAFEEFDAGGRLKKEPADATSTLPDKTHVTGANDLKRYLAEDRVDQVAFSVLKHLATYANGRNLTYNEINFLKQEGLKLKPSGYRMKDMVRFVVNSKLFLEK
jgi:mono/diheme cytochrome c family protein